MLPSRTLPGEVLTLFYSRYSDGWIIFSSTLTPYTALPTPVSPLSPAMCWAASHQLDPSCCPCSDAQGSAGSRGAAGPRVALAGCIQRCQDQHIHAHPLWLPFVSPAVTDISSGCQRACPSNRESYHCEKANQRDEHRNTLMIFKPAALPAKNCLALLVLQRQNFVAWGNLVSTSPISCS